MAGPIGYGVAEGQRRARKHDGSTGARDAVFRWPGWPVLGVAALLILARGRLAPRPAA